MTKNTSENQANVLLSTDTLGGYGLDLAFGLAKEAGCDGIDLAMRKNFDAWHEKYVKKLSDQYDLPVQIIQTSAKVNAKELNQAILLAQTTGAKHIAINPPSYFDVKTYSFLTSNLHTYQEQYPDIGFTIISPDTSAMKYIPLPKYRFGNLADIVKRYKCNLGLDISALDEETIDNFVMIKMPALVEHLSVCYVADRLREKKYLIPGEGNHPLSNILKSMYNNNYKGFFDIKLNLNNQTLVNNDKVVEILKKSVGYIQNHFVGEQ